MKTQIEKYSIEYHNQKNVNYQVFETYNEAKRAFDKCTDKDSFNFAQLYKICWDNGDVPIYNTDKLNDIINGYYGNLHYPKLSTVLIEGKEISDNNIAPFLDTEDLASYIDSFSGGYINKQLT